MLPNPQLRYFLLPFIFLSIFCLSAITLIARPLNPAAVLDFDGDGMTDYVVVRASNLPSGNTVKFIWYINGSSTGPRGVQWGVVGMEPVPADYDGDGKWDIAVWDGRGPEGSPAYFHIWRSSDNTYQRIAWGMRFDNPLQTQDFDGDGKADPTVARYEAGTANLHWYSLLSSTGEVRVTHFGEGADRPLRGDYDGDGKADLAVYRTQFGEPSSTFIIRRSSDNQMRFYSFGRAQTDNVMTAMDFDGDGKTDFCVVRLVEDGPNRYQQLWYWVESSTGEIHAQQFGQAVPNVSFDNYAPGDYDGDGKTDMAVWRHADGGVFQGYFYVARSRDGMFVMPWGLSSIDGAPAGSLQFR